jgi:hypothetical protein
MTELDQLLGRALDDLVPRLRKKKKLSEPEIRELVPALRGTSFPGLLALLGARGTKTSGLGQELLHGAAGAVAAKPAIAGLGASPDDVERALTAVFVHGASTESAVPDPKLRGALMGAAVQELAKRTGLALTPQEAKSALALLATGRFFGDLASVLASTVFAVRELPLDLAKDLPRLPHQVAALVVAVGRDLAGTPFAVPVVVEDLLADGKLDHPPAVLAHTMRCLLGFAAVRDTAHLVGELTRNPSVRLAVVIYARAHNIPLEEKDLDLLRDNVFDAENPDLGPALGEAVNRYLDQKGLPALLTALRTAAPRAD